MNFRLKTILGIAVIESVMLLILVVSALSFLSASNEEQLRQRAETTSRLFANATRDAVLATDLATLDSFVEEILKNPDVVYARIESNGIILAEGGSETALAGEHRPDNRLDEIDDGIFDTRAEISEGGEVYGVIEMGLSTTTIQQLLSDARRWTLSIAGVEIILVVIFSFILGTYLTRQLQRLKSASDTISRSGPGYQVAVEGNDEIADVARAFNAMSASLRRSYDELTESVASGELMLAIANRNQAKNEAILSASLDAIVTVDQAGKVLDFNEAAVRTFGWSSDEVSGRPMADFIIPPEMREAHVRGMKHYAATGEGPVLGRRLELTAQHRDGHQFPIEIAISPLETDQGTLFTAFIRDISDRLAAETELRLAAQAFDSGEAMLITDARRSIIRVNSAFTRITGYEEAEVLGKSPRLFASGKHDTAFYRKMWWELMQSGRWSGEIYNRRKNGEIFPEHLNISAVKNAEGETTHYVGHFVDISEQKRTEERLRRAQREAETASEAKSRFLATMSHEIRTPMNGVLGILGLLGDTPLNGPQQKLVRTGRESGELLLSIINDILDYSKMEVDKLELDRAPFDLHRLLAHAADLLRPQAETKDITLELEQEPGLARYAKGDPGRLRQILLNLINNAIKFTPGGSITIRASGVPGDGNRFGFRCAVEDTGIGIPLEAQARLFEEFTMVDQSHSRAYGGTGLGLAICRRLVSLMGGHIEVRSEEGEGSIFFFTVELETATADEIGRESERENHRRLPTADTRVLLAEDNAANQAVIKSILEYAGLRVEMVADGRKAIEAVRARPFDIVLMDISMPEMDGMEATREIRKLPGAAGRIPIVALTAHALTGDRERFLAAGMDDYLTKPIDRDAALRCIARRTGGQGAAEPEDAAGNPPGDSPAPSGEAGADREVPRPPQVLDIDTLERLARDTSPQILPRMLAAFREETDKRVDAIAGRLSPPALEQLQREAHSLKSSAGTFGALELQQLGLELELACRSDQPGDAEEKGRQIAEAWGRVTGELDRYLADGAAGATTG